MCREEQQALETARARLPEAWQQVIGLRWFAEKLTFAEIAERMGRTEDAVKQLFRRAFTQLTEELSQP